MPPGVRVENFSRSGKLLTVLGGNPYAGGVDAPAPAPRVAVVVLDWNGGDDTLACVASVCASRWQPLDVLVVDNASRQPVLAEVARRHPGVRTIANASNLGYAGGNNVGLRAALAAGADWVLVLNNDARVEPGTIDELVAVARRDPRIAAVGARILRLEQPDRLWMAWGEVDYRQSLVQLVGVDQPDDGRFAAEHDADWVSGCAILLSRRALEAIGPFDEEFFGLVVTLPNGQRRTLILLSDAEGNAVSRTSTVTINQDTAGTPGYVNLARGCLNGRTVISVAHRLGQADRCAESIEAIRGYWPRSHQTEWMSLLGEIDVCSSPVSLTRNLDFVPLDVQSAYLAERERQRQLAEQRAAEERRLAAEREAQDREHRFQAEQQRRAIRAERQQAARSEMMCKDECDRAASSCRVGCGRSERCLARCDSEGSNCSSRCYR